MAAIMGIVDTERARTSSAVPVALSPATVFIPASTSTSRPMTLNWLKADAITLPADGTVNNAAASGGTSPAMVRISGK